MSIQLTVNNKSHALQVDEDTPLLWAIRDVLKLTGTKFGCGMAMCGACTVHVDGQATRSCVTPVGSVQGKKITTIETIGNTPVGKAVQRAWVAHEVPQCGYCQSGQVMAAAALLAEKRSPTEDDISQAMSGNVCRCGTYVRIKAAIVQAARDLA